MSRGSERGSFPRSTADAEDLSQLSGAWLWVGAPGVSGPCWVLVGWTNHLNKDLYEVSAIFFCQFDHGFEEGFGE